MNPSWWKSGIEIFSKVSVWIVVPIVVALIAGKKLDAHFRTDPWIFLTLAALGFIVSCFGIFRVIKEYMQEIEDLGKKSKED
ncbi:MAG TPA: AtpZ/AtpI family protein [Candidatus Paceibacterota bacterium]|nr:AtpZ/AtpI family protein [Candidatus Paceibacterota bacterium]